MKVRRSPLMVKEIIQRLCWRCDGGITEVLWGSQRVWKQVHSRWWEASGAPLGVDAVLNKNSFKKSINDGLFAVLTLYRAMLTVFLKILTVVSIDGHFSCNFSHIPHLHTPIASAAPPHPVTPTQIKLTRPQIIATLKVARHCGRGVDPSTSVENIHCMYSAPSSEAYRSRGSYCPLPLHI